MIEFDISIATNKHLKYTSEISALIERAAKERGTGIAKREPEYITDKINESKAIIATTKAGEFAGFCYIETWGNKQFAANSGLIVMKKFRKMGLAAKIKREAFKLSRKRYPKAKMFGLTTSLPVMKINSDLGYRPVTFSELTDDNEFWKGCHSCVNYDVLTRTKRKHCLCTGMLFDPDEHSKHKRKKYADYKVRYKKWLKKKRQVMLSKFKNDTVKS